MAIDMNERGFEDNAQSVSVGDRLGGERTYEVPPNSTTDDGDSIFDVIEEEADDAGEWIEEQGEDAGEWLDENLNAEVSYNDGELSGTVDLVVFGAEGSVDFEPTDGDVGYEVGGWAGYGDDRVGGGLSTNVGTTWTDQFGFDTGAYGFVVDDGEPYRVDLGTTVNVDWSAEQYAFDVGIYQVHDDDETDPYREEVGASVGGGPDGPFLGFYGESDGIWYGDDGRGQWGLGPTDTSESDVEAAAYQSSLAHDPLSALSRERDTDDVAHEHGFGLHLDVL